MINVGISLVGLNPLEAGTPPPPTPAEITALEVTGPQTDGDLPVSYDIDETSIVAWGIGAVATPSAADLRAGTGMIDYGTATLDQSGGDLPLDIADGIDATGLNLWLVTEGSDTVVTAVGAVPFSIDTQSPAGTLAGTATGTDTADVTLNLTDEAGDIIDVGLWSESATPTEAEIEAGTGAAWHSPDNAGVLGDNVFNATGLAADTGYRARAVIADAQNNKTTLTSAAFTTAAAVAFNPASLFTSGTREGFWLDPSDATTIHQTNSATQPVTAPGQLLHYIEDKSGNGKNFVRTRNSTFLTWVQDGDAFAMRAQPDTSGDRRVGWYGDGLPIDTDKSDSMAVFMAIKSTDDRGTFLSAETAQRNLGVMRDGDTGALTGIDVGTPTYTTNGATSSSATQDELQAEWCTGTGLVAGAHGFSWLASENMRLAGRPNNGTGIGWEVDIFGVICVDNPTAQERADIVTWLQGRLP